MPTPDVTYDSGKTWKFQQTHIERLMDHAALTSAHPDDTLILAGPARWSSNPISTDAATGISDAFVSSLLPIGMVQTFNAGIQKPTQPMQAIGSGRNFFVSGKSIGNAQIGRLFVNGRNLLRVLYTNAVQAGLDVSTFDDRASVSATGAVGTGKSEFFMNLDSELFLIPFGMACYFRDKVHNRLGAFYLELCMINSYNISVTVGQNLVMENVTMMFDRAWPITMGDAGAGESGSGLQESALVSDELVGRSIDAMYPISGTK